MSIKISKKRFVELLRTILKKEIAEASTTATAGGEYDTPHAFSGKGKDRRKSIASGSGFEKVNEELQNSQGEQTDFKKGDVVKDINPDCPHVGSEGEVTKVGNGTITFKVTNNGKNYQEGDELEKTVDQMVKLKESVKEARTINVEPNWEGMWRFFKQMAKTNPRDWKKMQRTMGSEWLKIDKMAQQKGWKSESINEGRYHAWRNDDSLSPRQKIGMSMRETRDSLKELEKMVQYNVRLKTELNVDSRSYWKNTHKALSKISERLVNLANKVGQLH